MRAIRKPMSFILTFAILLSIIVVFPTQTKATEVEMQESGAVLDITAVGDRVNLHVWISDSPMGEVPKTFIYGHQYYLCYELINLTTGGLLNGYNYKVDMKFTQENRNLYSYQYTNSNNNWIGHTFNESGLCGGTVTVSGDVGIESSITFSVQKVRLHAWFSDTGMGETPSKYRLDNRYYLCYELINPETNNRVEGLSISVEETITRPDSTTFSHTYTNSNNNWISNVFDQVGTYGGSVKVSGDISGSVSISAQIYRVSLSECTITIAQTLYTYDGTEKKPSVTVKDGTKTLTNGTDYTVSYFNNKNVGIANAAITGIGNYAGSVNKSFTISYETILLNSSKTVNISTSGSVKYYSYTPSSSTSIQFYSTGSNDTYGYLFDSNMNQLASNDDGGENSNFKITYDLTAGETYVFGCKFYSSSSKGSFTVKLEQATSDTTKPNVSLSSTNNVASSQTVTISMSDNVGIKGYYWGTSPTYSNNTYTTTSSSSVSKTVDASGTYYATAVDTSGNVSSNMSITFYKTTLNANGGSVSPTSVLTKSGNSFTFPTPTRSNYSYVGWGTSSSTSASNAVKTLSPSSNTTYYAVWSYDDTQKPTVSLSSTNNVASSQTVTINLSDNVGIKGYYWGTSSTYSNNTYTTTSSSSVSKTVDASGTYYATAVDTSGNVSSNVSITFYKTTLNANGGSVSPTSVLTKSGNSFTFPTPTRSGYSYVGWGTSSSTSASNAVKSLTPSSNSTYYAVWSYNDTTKPTVSLSSTNNVASSQTVTISLSDNVGIKGYYWGTSSTYSNNSYTSTSNTSVSKTVDASGTYYATAVDTSGNVSSNVSITFYKTTLNANGGSVSPTSVLTKSGNSFSFPTPTHSNRNYSYVGWSNYSSDSSGVKSLVPSSNMTFYAIWKTKSSFVWGKDNLNFNNWPEYFGTKLDAKGNAKFTYRECFSSKYLNKLKQNLTATEYQTVFVRNGTQKSWMDDTWGGSCYGMACVELLAKEGIIKASDFSRGANSINDFSSPVNDMEINSLVNYYFMLQIKPHVRNQMKTIPKRSNETNIKNILSLLDSHSVVMVGINNLWHELLAYGYEYGSYTINGVTYNGKIYICDSNRSTNNYESLNDVCIYFNTKSYSWTIPLYERNGYSSRNCEFNHISANATELNDGGYVGNNHASFLEDYVGRLDAFEVSDNRTITKVSRDTNGNYMNKSSGVDDIEAAYSSMMRGDENKIEGYNLRDTDSAYRLSQPIADRLDLVLDYGPCTLTASSAAGKSVVFDNDGYIEVESDASDYTLEMIYDEGNPTDWFAMRVSGHGAEGSSLLKVDNGYILSSDNLNNVKLNANNKDNSAEATFSTNYSSVFIYEIDETHIGVKVDTDNNGTYETELSVENPVDPDGFLLGDVDGDNNIEVRDATWIQRHVTKEEIPFVISTTTADVDGDGIITVMDATAIQYYLANMKTSYKIGEKIK